MSKNNTNPLQYNHKVMNSDFKLCDFYIASSYKSYLPCTNYYDYVVEGYVDIQYFNNFASLYSVKAKANNQDVRIEYLVGSS